MKPLINEEDPDYRSAETEALELITDQIAGQRRVHSKTARDYAWSALDALTETDPDLEGGGWLFIRGRVYRVTDADHHDGTGDGDAWTVATRRERDEEEDPE